MTTLETQVENVFAARPDLNTLRVLMKATCRKCQAEAARLQPRCGYCHLEFSVQVFERLETPAVEPVSA